MNRLIIRFCGVYSIVAFIYGIFVEIPNGRPFTETDIVLMIAGLLIWLSGEWSWHKARQSSPKDRGGN